MTAAPLLFALAAGAMSASYAICLRLAANAISPALGAVIISATAFPFTLGVFAVMRVAGAGVTVSGRGVLLMVLAGVAAASTTVFALLAYTRGFRLSSSPAVIGTQLSIVLLAGFLAFDEPAGPARLLALGLIALGILLLQRAGA